MKRTWISEHGEGYAVPACITSALHDLSWHSDQCPHFCRKDEPCEGDDMPAISLWVEHPDPALRSDPGCARFIVADNGVLDVLLETYDAEEAVAFILKQPIP